MEGGGSWKSPSLTCKYDKRQIRNNAATSTGYSLRDGEWKTGRGARRLQVAARVTRTRPSTQRCRWKETSETLQAGLDCGGKENSPAVALDGLRVVPLKQTSGAAFDLCVKIRLS